MAPAPFGPHAPPPRPWLESRSADGARLKALAAYFNQHYKVDGLRTDVSHRLDTWVANGGGRICK